MQLFNMILSFWLFAVAFSQTPVGSSGSGDSGSTDSGSGDDSGSAASSVSSVEGN